LSCALTICAVVLASVCTATVKSFVQNAEANRA
jgi:hypothetical protein